MKAHLPTFESLESRRLLSAGEQDMTFGVNGVVPVSETTHSLLPAGSDKTYVVTANHIEKHNADGSLDTSYGTAGIAGPALNVVNARVQTDGKVVVICGKMPNPDSDLPNTPVERYTISRYTTAGQLDSTFGAGGRVYIATLIPDAMAAQEMEFQSSGKIIVRIIKSSYPDTAIYRLNANGTVDGSFHAFAYTTSQNPNQPLPFAVDSADKIYFAASWIQFNSVEHSMGRLNSDGTLDATFATGGLLTWTDHSVFAIQPVDGGKVLIASIGGQPTDYWLTLWRLNSNGSFDDTFGTSVVETLHRTDVHFSMLLGQTKVQLIDGGRILLSNDINIARLSSDGVFDESFGRVMTFGVNLRPPRDVDLGVNVGLRIILAPVESARRLHTRCCIPSRIC